ncbi:MAG TPA: metal-dependent transcriptional regulator [Balneolales bacterium]|nr:metal-dependent transcriptional regulator [Balneolales bacterium]
MSPVTINMLSPAQEDYLKHIFLMEEEDQRAGTRDLSMRLNVQPASVTSMLKKLADLHLIVHEPYRGAKLTPTGRRIALEIIRHHRLIELFLVEALGYGWEEVHEEAERLEHVISELFEERIADFLGHPEVDPHGDPIPTSELELPERVKNIPLLELNDGDKAVVERVKTQDRDLLNFFSRLNLTIGTHVTFLRRSPEGVRLAIGSDRFLLPFTAATHLLVKIETD